MRVRRPIVFLGWLVMTGMHISAQSSLLLCCAVTHGCRFVSLVVVCYLDRTSLAFAALQLCEQDWFNAKVYGLVSRLTPQSSGAAIVFFDTKGAHPTPAGCH
jgi:hypothetical protein